MTPKEKAIELADIYFEIVKDIDWRKTNSPPMFMAHVKKCALTAVDEIINELIELSNGEFTFIHKVEYWNEVKHEIEKL